MQGAIAVQSQPQQGTIFTLQIPHTPFFSPTAADSGAIVLTKLPVVLRRLKTEEFFVWHTGCNIFVLPYTSIEEYLVPQADQLFQIQQQRFLYWRDHLLPLYELSALLKYNSPLPDANF